MRCIGPMFWMGCLTLWVGCGQDFELSAVSDPSPRPHQVTETPTTQGNDKRDPVEEEEPEEPIDEEPPEDDCEHTSDLVYVIDRDSEELYLFNPEDQSFALLGHIDCSMWGTPSSMGITRDGFAYVRYSTGDLYEVSLDDLSCRETKFAEDFGAFGMGYATKHDKTWRDELFIANKNTLALVDTHTWDVKPVGTLPSQSELTGNSEGELWAFLPLESPPTLVRLDKVSAVRAEEIPMKEFPSTKDIDTFAFATWGGEFWLFVRTYGMGESTDVFRVTADGHLEKTRNNVGLNIVGAGVSTCAPAE